jgi:hypothetical protein
MSCEWKTAILSGLSVVVGDFFIWRSSKTRANSVVELLIILVTVGVALLISRFRRKDE